MNILMTVANAGVNDVRVVKEAEALVSGGHTVTVLGFRRSEEHSCVYQNGVKYLVRPFQPNLISYLRGLLAILFDWRFATSALGPLVILMCAGFVIGNLIYNFSKISFLLIVFLMALGALIKLIFLYIDFFILYADIYFSYGDPNLQFLAILLSYFCTSLIILSFLFLFRRYVHYIISKFTKILLELASLKGWQRTIKSATSFTGSYPHLMEYFSSALHDELNWRDYDVVHAHDLNTLLPVSRKCRNQKYKIVFDAHELATYEDGWKQPAKTIFKQALMRSVIKKIDGLVTVSEYFGKHFKDRYGTKNSCITYNAPDYDVIQASSASNVRNDLKLSPDTPLAVYVGGINERRGSLELGKALSFVSNEVHVAFVTNSAKAILDSIQENAKLGPAGATIHFLPAVPRDALITYISTADSSIITRLPSRRYYNIQRECALPNKLFESMFAHLPLVLGKCTANNDLLDNYKIGLSADIRDAKEFATALETVTRNPSEYAYSDKIKDDIRKKYSWSESSIRLIDFYKNYEGT